MKLDGDEFTFVREPSELLGGDYTGAYLRAGEYGRAADTTGPAMSVLPKSRLIERRISSLPNR